MPGPKPLFGLKLLFDAWRQSNRKFKISGLFLFAVFVIDAAATVATYGRIEVLWRPEMIGIFAVLAFFYVFQAPLVMHLAHIDFLRDLKRRQDPGSVLVKAMLFLLLIFIHLHCAFATLIKIAATS
jgi:hypothetical protein